MPLKVRVRNFQSIEDATLIIDGLTVVTGTNNAGKSAFFRAIRGAFTNSRGYAFVRYGTKFATVDIEDLENGNKLTWKKGKGVNSYTINGKEYPKVGHGVPPEARIFGIEPVTAGKTELWPQIAPHPTGVAFLLHEPGSVIAEAVADVERVNQLSRALKDCDSDKRSGRSKLKIRRGDLKRFYERREAFEGLDVAVAKVEELEKRRDLGERIFRAHGNLVKFYQRYRASRQAVQDLARLSSVFEALPSVERVREVKGIAQEVERLGQLQGRHLAAQGMVSKLQGLGAAFDVLPKANQVKEAQELAQKVKELRTMSVRLQAARTTTEQLQGIDEVEKSLPSEDRMVYAGRFQQAIGVTVGVVLKYEEALKKAEGARKAQAALDSVKIDDSAVITAEKFKKGLGRLRGLRDRYVQHRASVDTLDQQLIEMEQEAETVSQQVKTLLGDYSECPVCSGALDHVC